MSFLIFVVVNWIGTKLSRGVVGETKQAVHQIDSPLGTSISHAHIHTLCCSIAGFWASILHCYLQCKYIFFAWFDRAILEQHFICAFQSAPSVRSRRRAVFGLSAGLDSSGQLLSFHSGPAQHSPARAPSSLPQSGPSPKRR